MALTLAQVDEGAAALPMLDGALWLQRCAEIRATTPATRKLS
jgi:hypothetical protein